MKIINDYIRIPQFLCEFCDVNSVNIIEIPILIFFLFHIISGNLREMRE